MTVRVLLLEDEPSDAELVIREITKSIPEASVRHVATRSDFERQLSEFVPNIIVSDHSLAQFTGRGALELATRHTPGTPFILVTGSLSEEVAVEYMKAGATDYLLKDRVARLGPAVAAALKQKREREDREQARRAAVEALRVQSETLTQIINATPSLVYVRDMTGRLILANRAYAEFYGRPLEWLIDKLDVHVHPDRDEVERFRRQDDVVLATGRPKVIADDHVTDPQSGKTRWFYSTKLPIRLPGHPGTLVLGVSTDVTERRELEQQVWQVQKLEAVGTLAGGIAHDFNNLLAAVRTTADLALLDLPPGAPSQAALAEIVALVDRGANLTRQLLAFSRKQVLDPIALDLHEVVEKTVGLLGRLIGADIRLVVRRDAAQTTVRADPSQMEQTLMNLCVNARDAMPQGGELAIFTDRVVLDDAYCETHPWARPGDYARLTVSDTGIGMDEATRARIFEPFFTTKEVGQGTGLGLAVVYGIVKQHGGLIHVYSEPRRGTTFRIYLPVVTEAPTTRAASDPQTVLNGTERLLLAEDDDALRTAATRMLTRLGYSVRAVGNGHEALRALEEEGGDFDLAVLDVVMPEMAGVTVFEEARRRHPTLRFLFASGYSPGTTPFGSLEGLPATFLSKPYGIRELAAAVRRVLDAPPP